MCSNSSVQPTTSKAVAEAVATDDFELAMTTERERARARRADMMFGPTGPFRPYIALYLEEVAPARYKPGILRRLPGSISRFFRFVVMNEGIADLDEIRPSTVTRFVNAERARGIRTLLYIGDLVAFFVWLIEDGFMDRGNPVVSSIHRRQMMAPSASSI